MSNFTKAKQQMTTRERKFLEASTLVDIEYAARQFELGVSAISNQWWETGNPNITIVINKGTSTNMERFIRYIQADRNIYTLWEKQYKFIDAREGK